MGSEGTYPGADRRVHHRYFDKLHVRVNQTDNFTLNFSRGGISLVADTVLNKNETINLKMVLPKRSDPIRKNLIYIDSKEPGIVINAEAKLVWQKIEFERMTVNGLVFKRLSAEHRKSYNEFLRNYQQQVKN